LATALLAAVHATAQTVPSFDGTWVLDNVKGVVAEGTPTTIVIKQTTDAVTIERSGNGVHDNITYPFKPIAAVAAAVPTTGTRTEDRGDAAKDESSKNGPVPDTGGATGIESTGAEWKDGGLETMMVATINGKSVTQRTRRTLNAAGTEMTVENVLSVQHGYQSGGANGAAQNVYVKQMSTR
jgi:hypothetical protein